MTTPQAPVDAAARARVRQALDRTLFVEAGAGTGKTTALVDRVLWTVGSGRGQLREVAAITFTEAAAAELADRIRTGCERRARSLDPADPERDRYLRALSQIDEAAITTLHGFAQRILAEHPLEAGLPPTFEVLDERRAAAEGDEALMRCSAELLADPAAAAPLEFGITLGLRLGSLREAARQLAAHHDRLAAPVRPRQRPVLDLAPVVEPVRQAAALAARDCADPDDTLCAHIRAVAAASEHLAAIDGADAELDRVRLLADLRLAANGRGRRDRWEDVTAARELLDAAEAARRELLDGIQQWFLAELLERLRQDTLAEFGRRRREGRLTFHDLLVLARALLGERPEVRQALARRWPFILIDEFQDTDPLQVDIAVLLAGDVAANGAAEDWAQVPVPAGRLCFVGDGMQSIYRFRRADLGLYQQVRQVHGTGDQGVALTANFRSVPGVLAWVNAVIGALFRAARDDGQAPYTDLQAFRPPHPDIPAPVTVLGGPLEDEEQLRAAQVREREATDLARLLRRIVAEAWPVSEQRGNGEATWRPARYGDIAILMPTRTGQAGLEQALEEAGVPFRVESRSLVAATQEVRDLLAVLRSVDDPTEQVALGAALRTPAFGCGDDDLIAFRRAGGHWDYRAPVPADLPAEHPVAAGMTTLAALHAQRWWLPVSGLVERIIRECRLLELAFAHERPRDVWRRLRFVLDQARAFSAEGGTLREFVTWLTEQAEDELLLVEQPVPDEDDDAVRVLTIHGAKGLEFPITVLTGLGTQRKGPTGLASVLFGPRGFEARLASGLRTTGYDELATAERALDDREHERLLYVAATRARDHLVVCLHHAPDSATPAAALWDHCQQVPHLWRHDPAVPDDDRRAAMAAADANTGPGSDQLAVRAAWQHEREQLVAALSRAPVVAATGIRDLIAPADDAEADDTRRRGRAGTAIGRAVHACLQTVDLATGDGAEEIARIQAAAEGVADREDEIVRLVRAALAAEAVREAVAAGFLRRELYVAAPVGDVLLEGYVDLLYEAQDGLVVADYKTDRATDLDAAVDRYRLQAAAYALALEHALGRPVARCELVFATENGPRQRRLPDLRSAVAEIRSLLAPAAAPPR